MLNKILKRVASLSALLIVSATMALAQNGPIEGTVKVRSADGSLKPVPDALVEIYRTDINQRWEVKTDKGGKFIRLGMPLAGVFIVVASGPGLQPTWVNNVRLTTSPVIDIVANPGDGSKMTLEQVKADIARAASGAPAAPSKPVVSEADKAKVEAARKEIEAKKKESEELQNAFDQARVRYNQGVEFTKVENYQAAIPEFEAASSLDYTKHKDFLELAYKANANLAEVNYQVGVKLFNDKDREGAKGRFEKAVTASLKAIEIASTSTSPTINNDLILYYNILGKNAMLLIEHFGEVGKADATIAALAKAEALDAANKGKWGVMKGNIYRLTGKAPEAIEAYKAVLAADPQNLEALYNLALTYLASADKESLQQAANYLDEFTAKAPATDKRIADAKSSLAVLKNEFKVEAEKSNKRRGKQ